jgi:circadian clock protein KaiC
MSSSSKSETRLEGTAGFIKTGISGLDEVFLGGVRQNNIILVEGGPGTGKTSLGLEFIYRGAREYGDPGLIISFELAPEKLLRDASGFGWDFAPLEKEGKLKIIYTTPLVILEELQSPGGVLSTVIKEMGVKRLLIDGLTPLRISGDVMDRRPFRENLHPLVESLQRYGVTAVLTNEISAAITGEDAGNHERFVCDTILNLSTHAQRRQMYRTLEVTKSRGQDYITGKHTLKIIANNGVRIFRRAQSRPKRYRDQDTSTDRLSTGVPGFDALFGGGMLKSSITLSVGISGTGKTLFASSFLLEGCRRGEKGLLVTLDEHPQQLVRNADSVGLKMKEAVHSEGIIIQYDSPLELELDVHYDEIIKVIEAHGITRVVLDSLAAYESASRDEVVDFLYALASYLKDRGITAIFNYESPELLGVSQISETIKFSHLVDNIVLLNYVEISTRIRRAITVPKARGSANIQITREFQITPNGLFLLDEDKGEAARFEEVPQLPFSSYYGILARSPTRHSPIIEERLAAGESMPKSPKIPKAKV